jgi:hypothetical protein
LPLREQLASLVDTSNLPTSSLPMGHPFLNVLPLALYWSATSAASFPNEAWVVWFDNGLVGRQEKTRAHVAWCVCGGQTYDGQDVQKVIDVLPR